MKIAFVYDVIYPYVKGGVEKRIWEIAVRLALRGHDVHIIGMKYWEGDKTLCKDGVTLHGICAPQPLYTRGRRSIRQASGFGICLVPFLLKEKFDIIECQQFPYFPCFAVKLASVIKRTPFVITWYEVWGEYWYEYLGWKGALGKCAERVTAVLTPDLITVSAGTARNLRRLGVCREVPVFPIGISPGQVASVPALPQRWDLIFVGRLIREKHADLLVSAFERLAKESPDLTLLILGEGPEKQAVLDQITKCTCQSRIFMQPFLESHDQVIARIKSSHVCVIPSTREGFGITALEALACGLPVVTVDHKDNAISGLITRNTGFLAALSADDLAEKIRLALDHYPEMKADCIALAAGYDWDRILLMLESYYQALIR
jgi:glycosyltransferase involved in cell wall biosynthesis